MWITLCADVGNSCVVDGGALWSFFLGGSWVWFLAHEKRGLFTDAVRVSGRREIECAANVTHM